MFFILCGLQLLSDKKYSLLSFFCWKTSSTTKWNNRIVESWKRKNNWRYLCMFGWGPWRRENSTRVSSHSQLDRQSLKSSSHREKITRIQCLSHSLRTICQFFLSKILHKNVSFVWGNEFIIVNVNLKYNENNKFLFLRCCIRIRLVKLIHLQWSSFKSASNFG
jgi:hypothetical protein